MVELDSHIEVFEQPFQRFWQEPPKCWKSHICCGGVKRDVLVAAAVVVTCGCEAAPWASMINAYLPSLGSGVPFLLLYPAAPTAGHREQGDVCSSVCFLRRWRPLPHRHPTLQTLRTHRPEPVIGPASSACYTSARGQKWTICWMSSWHSMPGLIASYISISFICHRGS